MIVLEDAVCISIELITGVVTRTWAHCMVEYWIESVSKASGDTIFRVCCIASVYTSSGHARPPSLTDNASLMELSSVSTSRRLSEYKQGNTES